MAVRQYIGARYVPLYAGEWDATKNYEPLTVVTDANGNSFTSLKDVPAGTALTDRSYWIQTSSFSAAVDSLQRRVGSLEFDVSDMDTRIINIGDDVSDMNIKVLRQNTVKNRTFIIIGDSYADQAGEWAELLSTVLTENGGTVAANLSYTGIGFTVGRDGASGQNGALLQLQTFSGDAADVTDIVVAMGLNDSMYDTSAAASAIDGAISNFCSYAKQTFPNAKIWIGYVGGALSDSSILSGRTLSRREMAIYRYKQCSRYGATYLSNVELALHGSSLNYSSDHLHPSEYGASNIALALFDALTGSYSHFYPFLKINANAHWVYEQNGAVTTIYVDSDYFAISGLNIPDGTPVEIETINGLWFNRPIETEPIMMQISSEGYGQRRFSVLFRENKVLLKNQELNAQGFVAFNGTVVIPQYMAINFPTLWVN